MPASGIFDPIHGQPRASEAKLQSSTTVACALRSLPKRFSLPPSVQMRFSIKGEVQGAWTWIRMVKAHIDQIESNLWKNERYRSSASRKISADTFPLW